MIQSTKSYLYFLDDDNILHPELVRFIDETELDGSAYVFHQAFRDNRVRLRAKLDNIKVGGIDSAMALVPKEMMTDVWWQLYNYCADGVFFETIYNKFPERFKLIDKVMSYYNYLR